MYLFDKMEKEGFLTEIIKEAGSIHQLDGTKYSDLYFTKLDKEVWFLADFPNCIPKNKFTWIEFKAPKLIFSSVMGSNAWEGHDYWGWLIKYTGERIGFHYFREWKQELERGTFALAFKITPKGIVLDREIEFFAPKDTIDLIENSKHKQEELLEQWIPLIHPALFMLCTENGVEVNTTELKVVDGNFRLRK